MDGDADARARRAEQMVVRSILVQLERVRCLRVHLFVTSLVEFYEYELIKGCARQTMQQQAEQWTTGITTCTLPNNIPLDAQYKNLSSEKNRFV